MVLVLEPPARSDAAYAPADDTLAFACRTGESSGQFPIALGGPVRQWEMLRIYAPALMDLTSALSNAAVKIILADGPERDGDQLSPALSVKDQSLLLEIETLADAAEKLCNRLVLPFAALSVPRLRQLIKAASLLDSDKDQLQHAITVLADRIKDELKNRFFFMVPSEQMRYLPGDDPLFGASVQDRFPEMASDIEDAGWCLVIGRGSAAAYHLMCVMERSIIRIANRLQVPKSQVTRKTWGQIFGRLNAAVQSLPVATNQEKAKKERYSETMIYLGHVKDAWRNPSMHGRRRYTLEEAEAIFQSVKTFTNFLATKLLKKNR
jgi:hypothetical protein